MVYLWLLVSHHREHQLLRQPWFLECPPCLSQTASSVPPRERLCARMRICVYPEKMCAFLLFVGTSLKSRSVYPTPKFLFFYSNRHFLANAEHFGNPHKARPMCVVKSKKSLDCGTFSFFIWLSDEKLCHIGHIKEFLSSLREVGKSLDEHIQMPSHTFGRMT